uniref:Uncharacterized protein n=1 Tax=Arundo donax TaxID=35708 RepID=A0A0A9GQC2_ARUDO
MTFYSTLGLKEHLTGKR